MVLLKKSVAKRERVKKKGVLIKLIRHKFVKNL